MLYATSHLTDKPETYRTAVARFQQPPPPYSSRHRASSPSLAAPASAETTLRPLACLLPRAAPDGAYEGGARGAAGALPLEEHAAALFAAPSEEKLQALTQLGLSERPPAVGDD